MKELFSLIKRKTKNALRVECVRQHCAYRMHLNPTLDTLKRLLMLLEERKVILDRLQVDRSSSGTAMVILHCLVEKEHVICFATSLQEFPGIYELETIKL